MKCQIDPDLASIGDKIETRPAEHEVTVKGGKEVMMREPAKGEKRNRELWSKYLEKEDAL